MNDSQVKSLIEISVAKAIEENNKFLIANIESIMTDHKQPSPVTIALIQGLKESMQEMKEITKGRDQEIIKKLDEIQRDQKEAMKDVNGKVEALQKNHDQLEGSIRVWKWILPSISGVGGAVIANLIYNYLDK